MRYLLIDDQSVVVNVVLWDGKAAFDPGEGLSVIAVADDAPIGPGDTVRLVKGGPQLIAKAESVQVEPTIEDRLAALESKAEQRP